MTQVHTGNAHRQIVDGQRVRGISRAGHPVVFGGLIGVVGGMAFLLAGIAGLPGDAQSMLRSAAVALAVFALAAVLLRRRTLPALPPPAPGALRVYGTAVVVMLLLFPVTRLVARAADAPTAQIALVAAVVGAHFLPFARAFGAPVFRWIGGSMLVLGLVGALAAMLRVPAAGPAGAAAAGAAMLLIVAGQALRQGAPAPGDRLRA
ncbi:hypothetical protein [Micrococcus luteus]|uniref:hypothetical protein n=1 Tax=Micrococcus luteus TaxID=1270 RepID=UPI003432EDDE